MEKVSCPFNTGKTQYRKSETNIPRKGIARPQSQFPNSCVCERFLYSHDRSAFLLQESMRTDPAVKHIRPKAVDAAIGKTRPEAAKASVGQLRPKAAQGAVGQTRPKLAQAAVCD
jgi:hypothetical protein